MTTPIANVTVSDDEVEDGGRQGTIDSANKLIKGTPTDIALMTCVYSLFSFLGSSDSDTDFQALTNRVILKIKNPQLQGILTAKFNRTIGQ